MVANKEENQIRLADIYKSSYSRAVDSQIRLLKYCAPPSSRSQNCCFLAAPQCFLDAPLLLPQCSPMLAHCSLAAPLCSPGAPSKAALLPFLT